MNEIISSMLKRYEGDRSTDLTRALREILQEMALLGLWRAKFFETAAFYGDTALRILYGLDRYSEDLDFSLLTPKLNFDFSRYTKALENEIRSFGFEVSVIPKDKTAASPIRSAFLKADTEKLLILIKSIGDIGPRIPRGQLLKIKIEVDTNPPQGFSTETKFLLQPIPFSVKSFVLPDLFAGKMHAVLCRRWKNRIKGRDWYDLVWYAGRHPELNLRHLERRMVQSGHWKEGDSLDANAFFKLTEKAIASLNINLAVKEVEPFVKHPEALQLWSKPFFKDVMGRIKPIN